MAEDSETFDIDLVWQNGKAIFSVHDAVANATPVGMIDFHFYEDHRVPFASKIELEAEQIPQNRFESKLERHVVASLSMKPEDAIKIGNFLVAQAEQLIKTLEAP